MYGYSYRLRQCSPAMILQSLYRLPMRQQGYYQISSQEPETAKQPSARRKVHRCLYLHIGSPDSIGCQYHAIRPPTARNLSGMGCHQMTSQTLSLYGYQGDICPRLSTRHLHLWNLGQQFSKSLLYSPLYPIAASSYHSSYQHTHHDSHTFPKYSKYLSPRNSPLSPSHRQYADKSE